MKVVRLDEATASQVKDIYNNAQDFDTKKAALNDLDSLTGLDQKILPRIYAFGENFVDSWVKAMK